MCVSQLSTSVYETEVSQLSDLKYRIVPRHFATTNTFSSFTHILVTEILIVLVPLPTKQSAMSNEETSADRNVEIWKIKKLIKSLELARG